MLKDSYNFKNVDLSMAQMLIAIVLDYHGQFAAAERVLQFYNPETINVDSTVMEKRNHYQLEFLVLAKKTGRSFLATVIHNFYTQKILPNGRTRNNALAKKISLLDINVSMSEKELYNECMILLTSPERIIIHYMRTDMFYTQFKKWLRTNPKYKYDNFGRLNDLSDSKCRALLEPVISRIRSYSADAFDVHTLTPNNFVFNTLNMYFRDTADENGCYNKDSDVSKFYAILNSRGQDREISSGEENSSTTALSFFEVDLNKSQPDINFRDIAIKICKASKELYTHNNSSIAFYDIFSRYRDIIFLNQDYAKELDKILSGCSVVKFDRTDAFSKNKKTPVKDSLRTKYKHREEYLILFNKILTSGGVSMREIKTLYDDQIMHSKTIENREGRILYHNGRTNIKGNFKNSERFKKIYDGFIALKDFINFINSDANIYGITIYNFDTKIFRNLKLANAVTDLESYLEFGDVTNELIEEEPEADDGILIKQNQEVQRDLYDIRNITMFALLKNTPLGSIQEIQKLEEQRENEQLAFTTNINNFLQKITNYKIDVPFFGEDYVCPSDFVCDYILKGYSYDRSKVEQFISLPVLLAQQAMKENRPVVFTFDIKDPEKFKLLSNYLSALEIIMALDGVPMINRSGWFEFDNVNIIEDYLKDVKDNYLNPNVHYFDMFYRKHFVDGAFVSFFGNPEEDVPYWQKLRILFSVNNFLLCMLHDLSEIQYVLVDYNRDPLGVYIKMCEYLNLIEFDFGAVTLAQLYKIYNPTRLSYHTGACFGPREAQQVKKVFEKYLTRFYVNLFEEPDNKTYIGILKRIKNEMYNTFKPNGSLQNTNFKLQEKLREISEELSEIYTTYSTQSYSEFFCNDDDLLYYFSSCATFDDNGFALSNGKLYTKNNGKTFLYKYGCVITLDVFDKSYSYRPLTRDDVDLYQTFGQN